MEKAPSLCQTLLALALLILTALGFGTWYVYENYRTAWNAVKRVAQLEIENKQLRSDMEKYVQITEEQQVKLDEAVKKSDLVRIEYRTKVKVVREKSLGSSCDEVITNAIKFKDDMRW